MVASAAPAFATTAATTTGSAAGRLCFVDANRTALDVAAVQALDCAFGRLIGPHLDETESSRAVGGAVDDDLRAVHLSCFGKYVEQILVGHSPSQIPNIQSAAHYPSPCALPECLAAYRRLWLYQERASGQNSEMLIASRPAQT